MRLALLFAALALPSLAAANAPRDAGYISVDPVTLEADYSDAWGAYLAERRAMQVERLRAYAEAGVFPRNTSTPGLANVFMDKDGRRCGMAHLMWEDGYDNLVKVTAAVHNDVELGDVTDGKLLDWMLTSGLTQAEVAFIQEPDFQLEVMLEPVLREQLVAAEDARLRNHFLTSALQLEAYGAASLEAAVEALGERTSEPPPSPAVADAGGVLDTLD